MADAHRQFQIPAMCLSANADANTHTDTHTDAHSDADTNSNAKPSRMRQRADCGGD